MRIVEKNEGAKIPYKIEETKIILDEMLSIDLKRYQNDEEKVINISLKNDILQMGLGDWYVANIIIPAKKYELIDAGKDEKGDQKYERVSTPLNMDEVTLILWALPANYNYLLGGDY